MIKEFYSNGKLLLTGEYAVLDGAKSLALPVKYGQYLSVYEGNNPELYWKSIDEKGACWFEARFNLRSMSEVFSSDAKISGILFKILKEAKELNPLFLKKDSGYSVETRLTFHREWGLGSSSTLINNIAQWSQTNAYELLKRSFEGSGYDLACAMHNQPITYQLVNGKPSVEEVSFDPGFKEHLFFIHLNKKQNSRESISKYKKIAFDAKKLVESLSDITDGILLCKYLEDFESLIQTHEELISKTLQMPTVKDSLFSDYRGSIKSLGAWGGDFILATGNQETTTEYFRKKGFKTIVPYSKMVL